MRSVKTAYGDCKFWGKDEYVGRSLYNYHEFSGEEVDKILELANAAGLGLCLDIGCNIGFISMALASAGHIVMAFEPQPAVYEVAKENVSKLSVQIFNFGLGDSAGVFQMPRVRYGSKGNYGGMSIGTKSELGTIDVEVKTLDSLGLEKVGFIKCDVEGFEEKVLRGGVNTIMRDRPIMYIEDDRVEKSANLRKYITSLGYSIEEHRPPLYRENNFAGKKELIWDRNYVSHNIICRPC